MKSKISINIDSELLDIIRDVPDSDLDSIFQDALAQFLGVKQIWVKTNTLEQISSAIDQTAPKTGNQIETPMTKTFVTKKQRQPKFVLKIWDRLKVELGEEFTIDGYWDATKKCGFNYKDSARHSTILNHLQFIEEAGKIVKISERPRKYRKTEMGKLPELKSQSQLKESESQQEPEKRLSEIIEYGKNIQDKERAVEKELLA